MLIAARSALFFLFLAGTTILLMIVLSPTLLLSDRAFYGGVRFWTRVVLAGLRVICGVRMRVAGREHIPTGPALVAANHQSMWETIALFHILPRGVMVYKRELNALPIYRLWGKRAGVPVDRDAGAKALRAMTTAASAAASSGKQIIVFPEGTRTPIGERRAFQPGVAALYKALDIPCTPVAHNSGAHWRHPGPIKIPGEIVIAFLPPIAPGLDRKTFVRDLENAIAEARAGLPTQAPSAPTAQMKDAAA